MAIVSFGNGSRPIAVAHSSSQCSSVFLVGRLVGRLVGQSAFQYSLPITDLPFPGVSTCFDVLRFLDTALKPHGAPLLSKILESDTPEQGQIHVCLRVLLLLAGVRKSAPWLNLRPRLVLPVGFR